MLKAQLYEIVKWHKPEVRYVVDEMANLHGFEVLRSPVVHCGLNPIELVWADVKVGVARENTTFRMKDVKALVNESLGAVTPDMWQKVVTHVVYKVEAACWKADALQEDMAEQPIIPLGEADTSSDSESSVVDSDDDY